MVRYLYRQQTTAFKINLSFGFIGVLWYYHSSQNNARFFDVLHLIRTEEDLERFLEELSRLLSVQVPYHLWKGGRCYLMECIVVPLLDRVAGRLLCTDGLPILYIQRSGLWVLWQHVCSPARDAEKNLQRRLT
jgi:hypothetical protein